MMIQRNVSLRTYTSIGVDHKAAEIISVAHENEVLPALRIAEHPVHILGGGTNVVPTSSIAGSIIHIRIGGIEVVADNGDAVDVRAGAGVLWHDLVTWTVDRGLVGIENLALIPGTVGAAPIQNIGAYGVEQSACFLECSCVDVESEAVVTVQGPQCAFGYRNSIFKHEWRLTKVITSVTYRLRRSASLNTSYADVQQAMEVLTNTPTQADVYNAVIAIRKRKLPDPAVIGNAGSFFKNPVIANSEALELASRYHDMPQWPQGTGGVKIPAAWLIDRCGWKGCTRGAVGVHVNQALVLVHFGGGTGKDVWDLAADIQASVRETFGVTLEPEVQRWD